MSSIIIFFKEIATLIGESVSTLYIGKRMRFFAILHVISIFVMTFLSLYMGNAGTRINEGHNHTK